MDSVKARRSRCGEDRSILRCYRSIALSLLFLLFSSNAAYSSPAWLALSDGIQYKKIAVDQRTSTEQKVYQGYIHLFQIDMEKFRLGAVTAKQLGMTNFDARTMALKTGAVIGINGGFFSPEFQSLGLIVQDGKELNRLKWTSWWHIFQVRDKVPKVLTKQEYALSPDIEMAIEAGPRLLIEGSLPENVKPASAERTALGITADNKVIIAVTDGLQASMLEMGKRLKAEGCVNALNLDGGSSTQIYAKLKNFELNRSGFGLVANGIGVFPR